MEPATTYFIIDDDIDDQSLLIEALIHNDPVCRCFTANDGQEGINHLLTAVGPNPDVIFLDLNMPLMSGRECLAALKKAPRLQNVPVIIYSTTSNKNEALETMIQGASYFLTKKNSFKELYEALALIPLIADTNQVSAHPNKVIDLSPVAHFVNKPALLARLGFYPC